MDQEENCHRAGWIISLKWPEVCFARWVSANVRWWRAPRNYILGIYRSNLIIHPANIWESGVKVLGKIILNRNCSYIQTICNLVKKNRQTKWTINFDHKVPETGNRDKATTWLFSKTIKWHRATVNPEGPLKLLQVGLVDQGHFGVADFLGNTFLLKRQRQKQAN